MLNRKLSNYIFYGILALILVVVLLIRFLVLGNINSEISTLEANNISTQLEIDALSAQVQENKDVQTSQLYELYKVIPGIYSDTELTYKTVAILEELGINESYDNQRRVVVQPADSFTGDTELAAIAAKYSVIEVNVFFTTNDISIITDLLDTLYLDEQLLIVNDLSYTLPEDDNFVGVNITFFALYDVKLEEESQ